MPKSIRNHIGFKVYLPAKLDTKPYTLDPSIKNNYIHEQLLKTEEKLYEWALHKIDLPSIPDLSPPRTRPHLEINNNDVRAIPLDKVPHTKTIPEDSRIFS